MPLTAKQRKELNVAILGYLKANDYTSTFDAFLEESKEELTAPPPAALLERKWTALVRLTAKVQSLETQLHATSKQLKSKSAKPLRQNLHRLELDPRPVTRLSGHQKAVNCVLFHPSYPWLATCGDDSKIGVWCHETRKSLKWLRGHTKPINAIAFNHNGSYLASASSDMSIKIWNFEDEFRCERTLNGHEHSVTGVEFLRGQKNNVVASCSRDGTVKLWELDSGYCVRTLADIHDGEWVRRIRVSAGGGWMATCSVDKTVRVLALKKDFKLIALLKGHEHVVEDMAFAPTHSNKVLRHSFDEDSDDEDNDSEEDTSSSEEESDAENGDVGNGDVMSSQNERRPKFLASAGRDKAILVWDIERESVVFRLSGHENWVRSLLFHESGRFLVSCADDKSIRVWDLAKRRLVSELKGAHGGFVSSIDWHPNENLMVSASTDRDVKVWKTKKNLL